MAIKRRTTVTREGLYYLFVLSFIIGGALMREINLLLVLAGVMMGPVLLGWRTAVRQLRFFEIQRKLPRQIGAGELLVVDMQLANTHPKWSKWAVAVEDQVVFLGSQSASASRRPGLFFPFTKPATCETRTYQGRLYQRGEYSFGPLTVSCSFPMGLVRRTVTLDDQQRLLVYPRMGELTPRWQQLVEPDRMGNQRSQSHRGITGGEFHGLRDWRVGDSRGWIHWRTSARRNKLTVREFEQQLNQDLAILLDLGNVDWQDELSVQTAETAISFVATAVSRQCRVGSSRLVLVIAGQSNEIISGATSIGLSQEIMQRLATARTSRRDVAPESLAEFLNVTPRAASMVFVSTRPIDLANTDRFTTVWEDTDHRTLLGRMICLQVGSEEFKACFRMHQQPAPEMIDDTNETNDTEITV